MLKNFFLLSVLTLTLVCSLGCDKVWVSKEGETYTQEQKTELTLEEQAMLDQKYLIKPETAKVITETGEVVERSAPLVAGIADLFFPGAGIAILAILGTGIGLYKRWVPKIYEAQDELDLTATGARVLADAIDEFKIRMPEGWKQLKTIIGTKKVESAERGEVLTSPEEL